MRNFIDLYESLSELYENKHRPFPQGYVEAAQPINLSDCRMINSDVLDIRGELESSACLTYNGVLTRVAASVLPFRDGPEGKEVFLKLWRSAVYLLGGGVDLDKDGPDPIATVAREAFEESNMTLTNIKDSGNSYWEYSEKPWVDKHVVNPEDRWNGYYTWLFTADYAGTGDNELPEERDNFRWYKVSEILARPDTKKLHYIKQAIIQNGYANDNLKEDILLTEAKQLGYVSYAVRKTAKFTGHPLHSLLNILNSGYIKASIEEDGSRYVSLSRDILGHLSEGSDWKCGLILDGDKLTNKYKIKPVNYNSMIYFGNSPSNKQLMLRYVAKYQALDEDGKVTDRTFYVASMQGSSFLNTISESTYNILRTLIEEYNGQLAVSSTGCASAKYKNKLNRDVKKYYHVKHAEFLPAGNMDAWKRFVGSTEQTLPQWLKDTDVKPALLPVGSIMQSSRVPKKYADATWICTEAAGYNTPKSGLILQAYKLSKYREIVAAKHGTDVTTSDFFTRIGGQYADEAEERVEAQLLKFIDTHGKELDADQDLNFGVQIDGCIKGILIDAKHQDAFKEASEEYLRSGGKLYLYSDGEKTKAIDNIPYLSNIALNIRQFAEQNSIPIILFNPGETTNIEVLKQLR
jgi:8-oxo-dGTP pyrophosphatase MutT (NUDIX family)